jgi:hypothetical protein
MDDIMRFGRLSIKGKHHLTLALGAGSAYRWSSEVEDTREVAGLSSTGVSAGREQILRQLQDSGASRT